MEQKTEPRSKFQQFWSMNLWQGRQGYMTEKIVSLISGAGKAGNAEKLNWTPLLYYSKINLQWVKDYNIGPDAIIPKRKQGRSFLTWILVIIFFLIWHPKHKQQRKKINKWDYIKQKVFCTAKGPINKMKATYGMEKIYAAHILDKRLISKIYKELTHLWVLYINQTTQLKNGQSNQIEIFAKRNTNG